VNKKIFSVAYWLFFGFTQALGFILPRFANIHSNPMPLFLGMILLLPGTLLGSFIPEGMNQWIQVLLIVLVNAGAWYLYRKFIGMRPEG
jgi:hypothetical protein